MTAILDIDGTLVDTNYHHAIAWYRAFRQYGLVLPIWRIHRSIGMGGDQLVAALAGDEFEREHGNDVRAAEGPIYMTMIGEVEPFEGAQGLIADLSERGRPVVLASSAKQDEVEHYVDLLDARELADAWTTSAEVDATKPEPDLIHSTLAKIDAEPNGAVMVGDTTWDCKAAARAGVPTIAVRTGGFSAEELRDAGAAEVLESIAELRERIEILEEAARD